jgi:hypothetical protein
MFGEEDMMMGRKKRSFGFICESENGILAKL